MTKMQQFSFVAVVLAIVYVVPVVQTGYEFAHNNNHRIQMLDLLDDIFVSPSRKVSSEARLIDSLSKGVDSLALELGQAGAAATDSSRQWDTQTATRLIDEATIRTKMLRQSVLDYNRHIQGEQNRFAGQDTVKPYYRALGVLGKSLDTILAQVQAGERPAPLGERLRSEVADVKKLHGGKSGLLDYPVLLAVALRRTMVGNAYLRPYEKEMEKSSVFASAVRPWMLFAYYGLFGDLGDKGVQGAQGWFFYRPDVEYLTRPPVGDERSCDVDANDVPVRDSIVDSIVAFKNQLSNKGVDLLVVIMPGKPSIYPDLLSAEMRPELSGAFSHSLPMLERLKVAGVETVNLFEAFARERGRDGASGDSIYLRTDTHFKTRGVTAAAEAIARRIREYSWYTAGATEYAVDTVWVPRNGDVAEMTKLPAVRIRDLRLTFALESTKCWQVYKVNRDEQGAETGRVLYKDDYQRSKILVLGDSFSRIYQTDEPRSAGWISHLAKELSQPVASIVNDGGASTLVRQMLARKSGVLKGKKLVVWEIVERDFRFGAEGWKNVALQ